MENRVKLEYTVIHLCDSCKVNYKCSRLKFTLDSLQNLEITVLNNWKMDVQTYFTITDCDLYKMSFEVTNEDVEIYDLLGEDEDE